MAEILDSQLFLLSIALLFITSSISVVNGQGSGEWLILIPVQILLLGITPFDSIVPDPTTSQLATTTEPGITIDVVSITSSGSNTAGESYSLECTITVTGSTDQPTITWLNDNGEEMPSSDPVRTVTTSGSTGSYSSTLMFNLLAASHARTYVCRAALGSAMDSASRTIIVQSK